MNFLKRKTDQRNYFKVSYFTSYHIQKLKCITDLNVRATAIKSFRKKQT